jgi:hypothetical protein
VTFHICHIYGSIDLEGSSMKRPWLRVFSAADDDDDDDDDDIYFPQYFLCDNFPTNFSHFSLHSSTYNGIASFT